MTRTLIDPAPSASRDEAMGSSNSLAASVSEALPGEASTRTKTDGLDVRLFILLVDSIFRLSF